MDHPDWGAEWRQHDFDTMKVEFQNFLKDLGFVLVGWKIAKALPANYESEERKSRVPPGLLSSVVKF